MKRAVTKKVRAALAFLLLGGLSLAQSAATPGRPSDGQATVIFRQVFKSSYPEFIEIKVKESGEGTYDIRQLSDDADPESFQVSEPVAQQIFNLATKLHNFEGINLEISRRIANLGEKTFIYESGNQSHSVSFNYTTDAVGNQLLEAFQALARQLTDTNDLQHALRYDRLGVNDVLIQIAKDYDAKMIPDPERMLPLLKQTSTDQRIIDLARQRARDLASKIESSH